MAENILVTGPNTLQVEFDESFSNISELIVGGGDHGGCVTDANTDEESTQGAKPAGGNIGAQATGYVDGPDAQALTINRTNDTAVVTLDQRIDPDEIDLAEIHLVGPNGGNITSPSQATVPTQGPGPQPMTLDFGASEIPEGTVGVRLRRRARWTTFQYLGGGRLQRQRSGERRPGVRSVGRAKKRVASGRPLAARSALPRRCRNFRPRGPVSVPSFVQRLQGRH